MTYNKYIKLANLTFLVFLFELFLKECNKGNYKIAKKWQTGNGGWAQYHFSATQCLNNLVEFST